MRPIIVKNYLQDTHQTHGKHTNSSIDTNETNGLLTFLGAKTANELGKLLNKFYLCEKVM